MAAIGTRAADSDAMKNRRRTTTKTKRPSAPKVSGRRNPSSANANTKIALLKRERDEALEREKGTAEILRVISSSAGQLEPVFQAVLENAVRICDAKFGTAYLFEDNGFRRIAVHNAPAAYVETRPRGHVLRPPSDIPLGRIVITKRAEQVPDARTMRAYIEGNPFVVSAVDLAGYRTVLAVPMLKDNNLIGAIVIHRQIVSPFTNKQIALVESFATQAVIAVENARLLNELRESLDQQTATSEVLKVISSSPGDLEPVFQAMLENAIRICDAKFGTLLRFDGNAFHLAAGAGIPPKLAEFHRQHETFQPTPGSPLDRAMQTKRVSHTVDDAAEPLPSPPAKLAGARSMVCVPMLKDDMLIGAIVIYRQEVQPFTDKQTELLENFAAQAVIAIENTRLLNELRQSLEQQTATADVLRVISSSPGELEPVFQAMLENATRICEAKFGTMYFREGDDFRAVAMHGAPPAYAEARLHKLVHPGPDTGIGRVVATKRVVQVEDASADRGYSAGNPMRVAAVELGGIRTLLCVPMLKDNEVVGAIAIYRQVVRPFTDKQITLVQNFAAQAIIAIENTRLLSELRQRTDDLTEALDQQTATSEVLRVISVSPGELASIFASILENATRICQANFGILTLREGDAWRISAMHNTPPAFTELRQREPVFRAGPLTALARVADTKQPLHIFDAAEDVSYQERDPSAVVFVELAGVRTVLIIPMLKDEELIGTIAIYRQEVHPFIDKQIELVTNFAAQAVIAIEDTRLLNELRQSLQQQTATADVLKIISRSTFDLQAVLDTLVESAARLCEADKASINRQQGDGYRGVAMYGFSPEFKQFMAEHPIRAVPARLSGAR